MPSSSSPSSLIKHLTLKRFISHHSLPFTLFAISPVPICPRLRPYLSVPPGKKVEVEALAIQGPILATVTSQVKKLEVSVLVLGQKKPAPLISCFCGTSSSDELVDQCINSADCLTIGVRKQSKGMGGYLISTRWQKNFWLLA